MLMRDFFEGVGRVVCFVIVVGVVVWVRSELRPKPYTPPVVPTVTFDARPTSYDPDWMRKAMADRSPATDIGR
jgi:hypothetical protein